MKTNKLIIKNPRRITANGDVLYYVEMDFIERIIEKELLKRSIVSDNIQINTREVIS